MKYPIRLAVKDDYDKIVGLYEKAFEHREGLVAKYCPIIKIKAWAGH